jgi:hypothetical protein
MTKVTKVANLTAGTSTSALHYPELIEGSRVGLIKIDWTVAVITGTIDINIVGKIDTSETSYGVCRSTDASAMTFDETDFGSPAGLGTFSLIKEVLLLPNMLVTATGSNDASNVVAVWLLEE